MCVLFHVSDLDDILAAIASIPESVVERPHPAVVLGEEVAWDGVRIVHWRVADPGTALVEKVQQIDEDGASFTTRGSVQRGYAIEADGGRWAIVGVVASAEMYEEAVTTVATVVPL